MAFPIEPLDAVTEVYLGPTLGWVDVSEDARLASADSGGGIAYTRDRGDWGKETDPGQGNLVLNNRHGRYSDLNPRSEYFGIIGRNQPVRVGVRLLRDVFDRTETDGWSLSPKTTAYAEADA